MIDFLFRPIIAAWTAIMTAIWKRAFGGDDG